MTVAEPIREDPPICGPCRVGACRFAHSTFAHKLPNEQACSCECRRVSPVLPTVSPERASGRDQGTAG